MNAFPVAVIAADREGFIRAAPLLAELKARAPCQPQFVFAGEDYVPWARSELFRDLGLPYADAVIGASEGTPAERLAKVMRGCERLAANTRGGAVVLLGVSHTVLGCAIACAHAGLPAAHAEAGLRVSGLEGKTSIAAQIDRISRPLFAASEEAHDRLLMEGMPERDVVLAGSLVCDAIAGCLESARARDAAAAWGLETRGYALAVVETAPNIEPLANLKRVVDLLRLTQEALPVALCTHPRLNQRLRAWGLESALADLPRLRMVEPVGYVDYLSLLDSARLVLTDVGAVQDEAACLQLPCLTLAESTDRAATVSSGSNTLIGLDQQHLTQALAALAQNQYSQPALPPFWDGRASQRIAQALLRAQEELQ